MVRHNDSLVINGTVASDFENKTIRTALVPSPSASAQSAQVYRHMETHYLSMRWMYTDVNK